MSTPTPDPWRTLESALSVVRPVGRAAERLAVVALIGGLAVWWAVARGDAGGIVLGVLGIVLVLPPLALGAFALGVRALVALPRRLRATPTVLRERLDEIKRRAGEVTDAGGRGPRQRIAATVRLWWAVASSREVLEVLGPTTVLLTPATAVAGAIGAAAAVVETIAGAVALVWLAVT